MRKTWGVKPTPIPKKSTAKVFKYALSADRLGLLAYIRKGGFYHVHHAEMTELEKWIWKMLVRVKHE